VNDQRRFVALLASCCLLAAIAILVQVGFGAYGMELGAAWSALVAPAVWGDPSTLWALLTGGAAGELDTGTLVVWSIRLPRALAALLVGAALGVSGAVFQTITRNELASPYILGVSAGAGLMALLVMVFAATLLPLLPLLAALGGAGAFLLVYAVAWRGGTNPVRLVLAGVVVATMLGSLQTAVYLFADDLQTVHGAIAWTTGSLLGVDWTPLRRALLWILLPLAALIATARQLDVIGLGDRTAAGLGMRVERTRFLLAAGAVLLAAASVTIAGTVGFVGLIVPHIVRSLIGGEHRRLLIGSCACGAALLVVADAAARLAFNPVQVPVGILTGLLGGSYFLLLMRRRTIAGIDGSGASGRMAASSSHAPAPAGDGGGLHVHELTLSYGDGPAVVDDVSLHAPRGRITALVGPNGSGKSTVLRGIARQLRARGGTALFDGEDLMTLPRRSLARRLAVLQQEHDTQLGLSIEELVMHGRHPHRRFFGAAGPDEVAAVERALTLTGIGELRSCPLAELSGGQRQLAWLAMALAQGSPLLALDEPTTFLDIAHQLQLLELIRRLADEEGITVLTVLHDLDQAIRFADHLVVLHGGRVAAAGEPTRILDAALLAEVFGIRAQIVESVEGRPRLRVDGTIGGAGATGRKRAESK